jgi:3D (Asp-Asp-Asp) domain-containing protein
LPRAAAVAITGALIAGCGATSANRTVPAGPGPGPVKDVAAPTRPPIRLQLELPMIALSSAPTVSYTTVSGKPMLAGAVKPPGTTVYMLTPDGTRVAVNPRADGRFSVRARLTPGENSFRFTAARLGSQTRTASLLVSWRGRAAEAMRREMAADPAKFLPPASAGLNRKLPPLGNIPAIAAGGTLAVAFSLNTIKAPPPPQTGGPGRWLGGFELTEYYPALEAWFKGAFVPTPGLGSRHRIDWLYSARGLTMEGDGIGLDGRQYHVSNVGAGGWLNAGGSGAQFGVPSNAPFWRTGGFWRTASGALTFPLDTGGWANGPGTRYVPPPAGVSFSAGSSRTLGYLRSIAVDPSVIPFGSHVYIPSYRSINGGWFEADDTGGAIIGRHIDVFRPPPSNPNDGGNFATGETVYIVPPGAPIP